MLASVTYRAGGRCGPIVLAALEEAADARIVVSRRHPCPDCVTSSERLCETHHQDRARAEEYRRTSDGLCAVLGG